MVPSPGLCMMEFVREVVENLGLQLQVTDNLFGKVRTKLDTAKNIYIYINSFGIFSHLFIFGCARSSLLCTGFLQLQ